MSVIVNLKSTNEGILKNFLDSYFERDSKIDNDVIEWINSYKKPLEAIDIITAVIDNIEKYNIQLQICMDADYFVEVNQNNVNNMIKFMLYRFYKQNKEQNINLK